jgi:hypothetical protein
MDASILSQLSDPRKIHEPARSTSRINNGVTRAQQRAAIKPCLGGFFWMIDKRRVAAFAGALLLAVLVPAARAQDHDHIHGRHGIRHVLLISIDGFHPLDYLNCANGVSSINNGSPYCPHLAALGKTGVNYLDTTTSKPSDSFHFRD